MIAAYPAWGVGIGTGDLFMSEYSERHLGKPLLADNAQNWWRQVLVELGGVGGSAALLSSLAPLFALLALSRRAGAIAAIGYAGPVVGRRRHAARLGADAASVHPVAHGVAAGDGDGAARRRGGRVAPPCRAVRWCPPSSPWRPRSGSPSRCRGRRSAPRPPAALYGYGNLPVDPPLPAGSLWIGRRAVGVAPASGRSFVIEASLPHQDLARAPVEVVVSDRRSPGVPLPGLDTRARGMPA